MSDETIIGGDWWGGEGVQLIAEPGGIRTRAVCEGVSPVGDDVLIPWGDVLKHAPLVALFEAIGARPWPEVDAMDWSDILEHIPSDEMARELENRDLDGREFAAEFG